MNNNKQLIMKCFTFPHEDGSTLRYGYARATVSLGRLETSVIHLGAQQFAQVWINGNFLGRTYVRQHDDELRYETFSLTPHLRVGENVIAVLLHAWGVPDEDIPGVLLPHPILFAVSGGVSTIDFSDPAIWRMAPAGEFLQARRHNGLIGHEERRDLRCEPRGWKEPGFNDTGWLHATTLDAPEVAFRPSPLRPLREEYVVPARIVAQGTLHDAVALQASPIERQAQFWRIQFTLKEPRELTFYYMHRFASCLWVDGVEQPFSFDPPFNWLELYRPVKMTLPAGEHVICGRLPPAGEFQRQVQAFGWAECPAGGDQIAWGTSQNGPFIPGGVSPDLDHRPMIDQITPAKQCTLAEEGILNLTVEDTTYAVILEFSRSMTLLPRIEIAGASAGVELELVYSERMSEVEGLTFPATYTDRAILRDGPQTYEVSFQYKSARELMLIVRAKGGRAVIRSVGAIYRHYDYDQLSQFDCQDKRLNQIWEICRNTMEFGSQDVIMDGPWREQLLYIGDNYVHNQACYHLFRNHEIVEWQHTLYAQGQMPDGIFQPNQPCRTTPEHYRLLDQTILWPIQLEHHLRYTGRREFIRTLTPHVIKLMDGFQTLFARPDDPRLREVTGWNWVDHPGMEDGLARSIRHEGIPTAINILQLMALHSSVVVLQDAGDSTSAARLLERAGQLRDKLRNHHWNAARQVYADCVVNGQPSPEVSVHVNLLAIQAGLTVDPSGVLDRTWNRPGVLQMSGPFFHIHLFEVLHRLGRIPEMLADMRELWGSFLDAGLTSLPENNPINGDYGSSIGHPWGASPAIYLIKSIAGLEPLTPGWAHTRFAPALCDLQSVQVTVPTPYGPIHAALKQEHGVVTGMLTVPEPIELNIVGAAGVTITRTPPVNR